MNGRKNTHKVGLIGTGMVGASFAYSLMQRGTANELVLIDADTARAQGEMVEEVLDLPVSEAELKAFQASARTLREQLSQL